MSLSINARVLAVSSNGEECTVKFKNLEYNKGMVSHLDETFSITFGENPGWDVGDEVDIEVG